MSAESNPRWLPMQGCVNFRDLGGYRNDQGGTIRWRRLFRSDALQEMTVADSKLAAEDLNIGLVVDLRNSNEANRDGLGPLPELGTDYRHFPFLDARGEIPPFTGGDIAERLAATYLWMLENSGEGIGAAVGAISDSLGSGRGAVFHCSAGKDRTGLLAALILDVLGVDAETIEADYMLTGEVVEGIVRRIKAMEHNPNPTAQTLAPQPLAFRRFHDTLQREYEGAESYLRRHGVSGDTLERLRNGLLE